MLCESRPWSQEPHRENHHLQDGWKSGDGFQSILPSKNYGWNINLELIWIWSDGDCAKIGSEKDECWLCQSLGKRKAVLYGNGFKYKTIQSMVGLHVR